MLNGHVQHELIAHAIDQSVRVHLLDCDTVGIDRSASLPARPRPIGSSGSRTHESVSRALTIIRSKRTGTSERLVRASSSPASFRPKIVHLDPAAHLSDDCCAVSKHVCHFRIEPGRNEGLGVHDVDFELHASLGRLCRPGYDVDSKAGQD